MLKNLLSKVTGGEAGDRAARRLLPLVEATNAIEAETEALSDAELRAKTDGFRARIRERSASAAARLAEARRRLEIAVDAEDPARRNELDAEVKRREKELFAEENAALDELLPEAFAAVREAAKRGVGQRHFDVQLLGGAVLHQARIAEMRTGEGKTLVATLPAYLNALLGHGVHVVTVNDYLARRDAAWMGPIYHRLGLTVGVLQGEGASFMFEPGFDGGSYPNLRPVRNRAVRYYTPRGEVVRAQPDRSEAYQADITYGTNNEFGFDYLRDNLAYSLEDRVQRALYYAIVDEVDNIFIDEARTPLIISGFAEEDVEEYRRWAGLVRALEPEADFLVHEKERHVELTTRGLGRIEELAGISNIYDEANAKYVHHLEQALSARALFLKGREYIVQKGRVVLVDEHTGRLMADRRLSDGLHQAIEAKEAVAEIRPRMVTQATITIQNYFRMYRKLSGMTGTAKSEQEEFLKIYNLEVVVAPTNVEYRASRPESNLVEQRRHADGAEEIVYVRRGAGERDGRPVFFRRTDYPDLIYRTGAAKWQAIVEEISELHHSGRPVLVGTTSVEKSEQLGQRLRAAGIPHQILNAKYHAEEAAIIARAGERGAVTVATNMAGRGVDIRLGGELSDSTIHAAQTLLRGRGLDPFRVSDEQLYSAIAEVDPEYVRSRNQVLALGGLHVLGTERHDARRIDNQLRGRAGRQGEPGSSRFYVSLDDDMMRVFGGDRIDGLMKWAMGGDDSIPLTHSTVSRALDTTQARVEGYHFDTRKHVLEYDDVLNRQRDIIYSQRLRVLTKDEVHEDVWELLGEELDTRLGAGAPKGASRGRGRAAVGVDAFAWLEAIMPLAPTPPGAAWSYPYRSAPGLANVMPSFTIWFVAERLAGSQGLELSRVLTALVERALDGYREEIVARAIEGPLDDFFAREKSGLDELGTQLEEKAEEYILWQQEQEKPLQPRAFAEHLKRLVPGLKNAPVAEVQAQSAAGARRELAAHLERTYYHQTTLDLLNKVYLAAAPFRSDWATPAELADDLQALAEQALSAPESPRAARELERLIAELERGADGGRLARTGVIEVLVQIASLGSLPLAALGDLLRETITAAYDRWAARQRQEFAAALEPALARVRSGEEHEIVQLLVDSLHVVRQYTDQRHQKVALFQPRLPLPYLAHAAASDLGEDDLRDAIVGVLDEGVARREAIWGQAEHARLAGAAASLGALEPGALESLGRYWGQQLLEAEADTRVADLPDDAQAGLRTWLTLRAIEDDRVAELPDGEALEAYLSARLVDDLEQRWSEQDEVLRQDAENALRAAGAFEDPDAEGELLAQTRAALKPAFLEALATRLGRAALDPARFAPVADLPETTRADVRAVLLRRGVFNDEKRVQHFLVEQRLVDLGEEAARQSVQTVAAQRLARLGGYRLEELDEQLQGLWRQALRAHGALSDPARRTALLTTPLRELGPAEFDAIATGIGRARLAGYTRGGDLPAALQARAVTVLARSGALGPLPVAALGPEVAAAVRRALADQAGRELAARPVGELPDWLRALVFRYLEGREYFVDAARAAELNARPLGELDSGVLAGLEAQLGAELIVPLRGAGVQQLDDASRAAVLRYFDARGLFRKKEQRQRLLATRVADLSALQPGLYDDVATHLGRERLDPVRHRRIGELAGELRARVQRYLRESDSVEDHEKREVVELLPVTELEPEVRAGLDTALAAAFERLIADEPVDALPPAVRARVDEALAATPAVLAGERQAAFAGLVLAELPGDQLAGLQRALGTAELEPLLDRTLAALDGPAGAAPGGPLRPPAAGVGYAAWQGLEEAGLLYDLGREAAALARRMADLAAQNPEAGAAVVAALADSLYNEAAGRRVAELDEDLRRGLREALDEQQAFGDAQALEHFDNGRLADLRAPDYEAVVAAVGRRRLAERPDADAPLAEWPDELRAAALAEARASGLTLDAARLSAFRERGPLALADNGPENGRVGERAAADRVAADRVAADRVAGDRVAADRVAADGVAAEVRALAAARTRRALATHSIAELDERLRRQIEDYLEAHAAGRAGGAGAGTSEAGTSEAGTSETGAAELARLAGQRLGALDPDLLGGFAGFWGRRRLARLAGTPLGALDEETSASLAEFFGRRLRQNLEKALMLTHISRLWIDYLTEIEHLRQGIGLQAFGQRDPLVEYKRRAFQLFDELRAEIRRSVIGDLFAPRFTPPGIKLATE